MSEKIEYCFKCDCATGRAGKGDDSIYLPDGTGPLCEECYEETKKRMSDANIAYHTNQLEDESGSAAYHIHLLEVELNRARAAELSMAARVAELEAAAAGMTGTPTHEGRYWCSESETGVRPFICEYHNDEWTMCGGYELEFPVIRFHRLPGETYTPVAPSQKKR